MTDPFHTIFVVEFLIIIALRLYWHRRAETTKDPAAIRAGIAREGGFAWVRWVVGVPAMLTILCYLIAPGALAWSALPLPDGVRWAGAVLVGVSIVALVWVHFALDRNFNTTLVLRADHELVMHGPYRWVRHPMYTSFILLFGGLPLLSANVLLALLGGLVMWALLVVRTPLEEAQLRERFGEQYAAYQARTGALLPRWRLTTK